MRSPKHLGLTAETAELAVAVLLQTGEYEHPTVEQHRGQQRAEHPIPGESLRADPLAKAWKEYCTASNIR